MGAGYVQTNLVSTNSTIPAVQHDANLVNAWGIAESTSSPFWVGSNGMGLVNVYNTAGATQTVSVVVPPPSVTPTGTAAPTGVLFNNTTDFKLTNGNPATFIFATEDGTVSAWNSGLGTASMTPGLLKVDDTDTSANSPVFKGVALANNGTSNVLYVSNFRAGVVQAYGPTFAPISLPAGKFTDPNVPAGFAPFNIQTLGGNVYVTYAKQDQFKHDDVAGAGLGRVDEYDQTGTLIRTIATGGALNSPWGLAIAPSNFGTFSGDLLIGNFGDGSINAYAPTAGTGLYTFAGTLSDVNGAPITIDGLWALQFGNGGNGGLTNVLYFSAGPQSESLGLFGSLAVAPEPASLGTLAMAMGMLLRRRPRSGR
jgi:uncharacterized protein (TIGR03118 family)